MNAPTSASTSASARSSRNVSRYRPNRRERGKSRESPLRWKSEAVGVGKPRRQAQSISPLGSASLGPIAPIEG